MPSTPTHAYLLGLALVTCGVKADLDGSFDGVQSQADSLQSLIDQWSASQGLQGALSIQDQFPALSNAVASLSQAVGYATSDDIAPESVTSLAKSISALLQSLTDKAGDFDEVGATDIVSNDISALKQPAVEIINGIASAVSVDCAKAGSLSPALSDIVQGFSSADGSYSLPSADFPASIGCQANNAGTADANSSSMLGTEPTSSPDLSTGPVLSTGSTLDAEPTLSTELTLGTKSTVSTDLTSISDSTLSTELTSSPEPTPDLPALSTSPALTNNTGATNLTLLGPSSGGAGNDTLSPPLANAGIAKDQAVAFAAALGVAVGSVVLLF